MAVPDIDIKFDLYESSETIGVSTNHFARGTRLFRAIPATNDDQTIHKVLVEAIRQAGPFYHAPTDPGIHDPQQPASRMRLQRAYAKRFGLQVRGKLHYGFDRWARPSGELVADFSGSSESTESYRYSYDADGPKFSDPAGLPDGAIYVNESWDLKNKLEGRPKVSWKYFRPVVVAEVGARLSFNPIGNLLGLLRHINSDEVVFGNQHFAAFTIRFDHIDVEWVETRFGDNFIVLYKFTIITGGHFKHFVQWKLDDPKGPEDGPGIWEVVERLVYQPASFAGKFPL